MSPTQLENLNAQLDRVPVELLREALRRRRNLRATPAPPLNDLKKAQFKIAMGIIRDRHQLPEERILGNGRHQEEVAARWALYRRLHELGWNTRHIAQATGHDTTRISHALKVTADA